MINKKTSQDTNISFILYYVLSQKPQPAFCFEEICPEINYD